MLTNTDGAEYEPLIAFGAWEDAIDTTSNPKKTCPTVHEEVEPLTKACADAIKEGASSVGDS